MSITVRSLPPGSPKFRCEGLQESSRRAGLFVGRCLKRAQWKAGEGEHIKLLCGACMAKEREADERKA